MTITVHEYIPKKAEVVMAYLERGYTITPMPGHHARHSYYASRTEKNSRPWSEEDDARLQEMLAKGMSESEIGRRIGRTRAAINARKRKLKTRPTTVSGLPGWGLRTRNMSEAEIEKIYAGRRYGPQKKEAPVSNSRPEAP